MPETNKRADTTYPIHDLLSSRWSPRAFADRPILPEVLGSLFEAARWAPSSRNLQPWHFVVAERHRDADGFARILSTLIGMNKKWGQHASVLLIAVTEPKPEDLEGGNPYAQIRCRPGHGSPDHPGKGLRSLHSSDGWFPQG